MKYFLAIIFVFSIPALQAQDKNDKRLTVSSEGLAKATPDIIKCSFSVAGTANLREGMTQQKACDKVLADLKVKNLAKAQSTEEEGDGEESGQWSQGLQRFYKMYTVQFARPEDFVRFNDACNNYTLGGITVNNNITYLGMSDSTRRAIREVAFRDALVQARAKATAVTQVLGATVGGVLSVTEQGSSYEEDDEDGADSNGRKYSDYYIPGKPIRIPYVAYVNVVFALP